MWQWADEIILYNPIVKTFLVDSGVDAEKNSFSSTTESILEFFSPEDRADRQRTRVRYGLPLDKPIVLFVGRLVPKKGVEPTHRGPRLRLPHRVGRFWHGYTDPEDVTCLGPLGRHELRDVYRAVTFFAFPAVGEMLTLVIQEAMSCGLPSWPRTSPTPRPYRSGQTTSRWVPSEAPDLKRAIQSLLGDRRSLSTDAGSVEAGGDRSLQLAHERGQADVFVRAPVDESDLRRRVYSG